MTASTNSTLIRKPRAAQLTDDEPPSISARADHAAVLLREFALQAARHAAAELNGNVTAAARAVSVIEANTWSKIAAVLKDTEPAANEAKLSPLARLANAFTLIQLDCDTGLAQLNFDFHYALVTLAKANLKIARLETLEKQAAAAEIPAPVEAGLAAIVDGLLDAIPDMVYVPAAESEQFAA